MPAALTKYPLADMKQWYLFPTFGSFLDLLVSEGERLLSAYYYELPYKRTYIQATAYMVTDRKIIAAEWSLDNFRSDAMPFTTIERVESNLNYAGLIDRRTGERTVLWHRDERLALDPSQLVREQVWAGRVLHVDGHDVRATAQAADMKPFISDMKKIQERARQHISDGAVTASYTADREKVIKAMNGTEFKTAIG
ncbi:MAG: hypothetical protein AAB502_00770, partial [Chloroflexota bacterium]